MPYNVTDDALNIDDSPVLSSEQKKARKLKVRKTMNMAILAGEIMLESGAETYRVEDTVERLCQTIDIVNYVDIFVIPTGIFLTIGYDNNINTVIKRTQVKSIDLNKITMVNQFSRTFVSTNMTIDEALDNLIKIKNSSPYHILVKSVLGGGLVGGFSSLLFGGDFSDMISAFFISVIVILVRETVSKNFTIISYVKDFLSSLIASGLAVLFIKLGIGTHIDEIIIGSIMPLFPGFALTNATRDSISGDFLAGLSRGTEAILCALSIALGVGIAINYFINSNIVGGV